MAIKIAALDRISKTRVDREALYRDLALDTRPSIVADTEFGQVTNTMDLKADANIEAIRNSLHNLFNTMPGQRFLWPDYGLDFYQFLFWPVTESNGIIIANKILTVIDKFEPRVYVQNVKVIADPDGMAYNITLSINIPTLGMSLQDKYNLDIKGQTFMYIPTSRNT